MEMGHYGLQQVLFVVLGGVAGEQNSATMCSPVASSPDLTCMEKPAVHGFRSCAGTSCAGIPVFQRAMFVTVSLPVLYTADWYFLLKCRQ